jgi:hypothetical protein
VLAQTRKDNVLSKLELRFELWVTGELTAEANSMIAAAQVRAELKGYSIRVFYASDLDQQVSLVKDPSLRKVVDQHFLHAPMAFPDAVINPLSKRSVPQSLFDIEDVNNEAAVTLPATTLHDLPAS